MVVGVGFCKIKLDSNFLLVLKIKCTKFHQDRSKTKNIQFYIYRLPTSERKTRSHGIIRFFQSFVNKLKKVTITSTNKRKCHNSNNHATILLEYILVKIL
jgi:hypothetical protein